MKKVTKRRMLFSLALAMVMLFAMTVTAAAADKEEEKVDWDVPAIAQATHQIDSQNLVGDDIPQNLLLGEIRYKSTSGNTVTIDWDAVAGATHYIVYYGDDGNGSLALWETTPDTKSVITYNNYMSAAVVAVTIDETGQVVDSSMPSRIDNIVPLDKKIAKKNFGIYKPSNYDPDKVFGAICNGHGYEMQFVGMDNKGKFTLKKAITNYNSIYGYTINAGKKLKANKMYKYRVRAYVQLSNGKKKYGKWSAYRYYVLAKKFNVDMSKKSFKFTLKWSKCSGVSKIKVMMSDSENGKYKAEKTLKGSATSVSLTTFRGKKLKKNVTYYIKVVFVAKDGKKSYDSDLWYGFAGYWY